MHSKPRYLETAVRKLALDRSRMAFISGPRQSGKTTLAKGLESGFHQFKYLNWDESKFRRQWTRDPESLLEGWDLSRMGESRLLVLDEIHKSKLWKQKLKGLFDHHHQNIRIAVTGSARLNVYNRGGDSLLGRYLHFRLYPFSIRELLELPPATPEEFLSMLGKSDPPSIVPQKAGAILDDLERFSGFPEPYLERSEKILNLWRQGRTEKIIREDLRDLSRIPELSQLEMLASLLSEKVGGQLSVQSLREDLEVAFDTVKRWLTYLNHLYYFFEIRPWVRSIPRSLKKEPKIYLYDWTEVEKPGARFENIVAFHLLKACHFWTDTGEGRFDLHYLRDKEKNEVDFLISRDRKPWLTVECKLSDGNLDPTFQRFQRRLGCPHLQITRDGARWRRLREGADSVVIASADIVLSGLI